MEQPVTKKRPFSEMRRLIRNALPDSVNHLYTFIDICIEEMDRKKLHSPSNLQNMIRGTKEERIPKTISKEDIFGSALMRCWINRIYGRTVESRDAADYVVQRFSKKIRMDRPNFENTAQFTYYLACLCTDLKTEGLGSYFTLDRGGDTIVPIELALTRLLSQYSIQSRTQIFQDASEIERKQKIAKERRDRRELLEIRNKKAAKRISFPADMNREHVEGVIQQMAAMPKKTVEIVLDELKKAEMNETEQETLKRQKRLEEIQKAMQTEEENQPPVRTSIQPQGPVNTMQSLFHNSK